MSKRVVILFVILVPIISVYFVLIMNTESCYGRDHIQLVSRLPEQYVELGAIHVVEDGLEGVCDSFSLSYKGDTTRWHMNGDPFMLLHAADSIFLHSYEHDIPVELTRRAIDIIKKSHGLNSREYGIALCTLANLYSEQNQDTTLLIANSAIKILQKYPMDINLAKIIGIMAYAHVQIGTPLDYKKAKNLTECSLKSYEDLNMMNHPDYANTLVYLSEALLGLNQPKEALSIVDSVLHVVDKCRDCDFRCLDTYAYALHVKVQILYNCGMIHEALEEGYKLVNIRKEVFGSFSRPYAVSLFNLAAMEEENGLYKRANEHYEEVTIIEKDLYGLYTRSSLINYSHLLQSYLSINKLGKARECYEQMCQIYDGLPLLKDSLIFATIHYRSAYIDYHLYIGNYDTAYTNSIQSYELAKKSDYLYGERAFSLKVCESLTAMGRHGEAYDYALLWYNYSIRESGICRDISPLILTSYNANDFEGTQRFILQYISEAIENIQSRFPLMSRYNRERFLKAIDRDLFKVIPFYIDRLRSPMLLECLYNILLIQKGLLMRTELDFEQIINKGSECVKSLYEDYCLNVKLLEEELSKPLTDRLYDVDSLNQTTRQLLNNILLVYPQIKESTNHLSINVADVRNVLNNEEIAIEFVDIEDQQTGDYSTKAILVDNGMSTPVIVDLFNEIDLMNSDEEDWYNSHELYSLIWKPLEPCLRFKKKVYFSASSSIANIAIESVLTPDNKRISDIFEIHRLSSTKELVINRDKSPVNSVALYGGLDYNADIMVDSLSSAISSEASEHYKYTRRSIHSNVFKFLPQTKVEVEQIKDLIVDYSKKYFVASYTNDQGTEESFNNYCSIGSSILHFATHGFFLHKDSVARKESKLSMRFRNIGLSKSMNEEDKAMFSSGLILSGGNVTLSNMDFKIPPNRDGILTAYEISTKHIPGLDLVVLSACETGIGLTCGEGVYGLQRAFKIAGAGTILMSLWEIDDTATQLLMVDFYKNIMQGMTKYQSLRAAQQYVKSHFEYKDPEYWAGFVLLDALN